jgi:hypothetical protein
MNQMDDIIRISNLNGKQEDFSIFDITNGQREITEEEVKNAPMIMIEVN